MDTHKDDSLQAISVQLDGVKKMPTDEKLDNYDVLLETWEVDNSKIITWINNSVTPSIYWASIGKYQLETDIRALHQNDTSIQDFYSSMSALWDQLALSELPALSSFDPYIKRRESQGLVQFLMALHHDFEGLRGSILHCDPLPSVDSVVSELLVEEICLKSLDDRKIVTQQGSSVFVASQRSLNGIQKGHWKSAIDECAYCKQKGHWKSVCPFKPKASQQQVCPPPKQPPHLNNAVAASSFDPSMIEQFHKYLSFQNHTMTSLPVHVATKKIIPRSSGAPGKLHIEHAALAESEIKIG
ncbi:hypothetical protein CTI12_AA256050 [Artemisia annua]|uniref:Retrotransposon gag domain-containing protein n=1 Tax=Artemisia annua TaxID=35608 RepID=A0A2U1LUN1_ARTAN|nr:hypothetical protein CTI12_AA256050 [Artemisia annua]